MKIKVTVKGQKDPIIYSGDRIDVLDFEMNGEMYKQIRYFRKGFSKSELLIAIMSFYGCGAAVLNKHFGKVFLPVGKPFGIFK